MMITEARKLGANEGGCSKMKFDLWLRDYLQKLSLFLQASNNAVPLLEGALLKVVVYI